MIDCYACRITLRCLALLILPLIGAPWAAAQQGDTTQVSLQELESRVVQIFDQSCARSGCHAGPNAQQGMDLSPEQFYASTVGERSQERPELLRVHPGQPDSSYLLMKVKGAPGIEGVQMPLIGDKLSEDQVDAIAQWISRIDTVDQAREQRPGQAYPYDGWKIMNLPTTRALDAGSWLFLISHRFNPPVNTTYDTFFGLDGSAIIYLSLGYAFTDRLLVSLARSNAEDDVELQARYQIKAQREGEWPVGVGVVTAVNWISEQSSPDVDRFRTEAFKLTGQVSLTRAFGDRIGVAVVPGLLINPDHTGEGEAPLVTIGLGGRWNFHDNLSIVGEWVPIVSGYTRTSIFGNDLRFDSWGGGLEITVGGHVFQIVLSNSIALTTDQYLRGGDLDIREFLDGEVRLGFNIFRILNF